MQNYNIKYNNHAQNTAKNNTNIKRSKVKLLTYMEINKNYFFDEKEQTSKYYVSTMK